MFIQYDNTTEFLDTKWFPYPLNSAVVLYVEFWWYGASELRPNLSERRTNIA